MNRESRGHNLLDCDLIVSGYKDMLYCSSVDITVLPKAMNQMKKHFSSRSVSQSIL